VRKSSKVVAALLICALFAVVVYGLLSQVWHVSNHGNIRAVGVGVYSDEAATKNLTSIDWGITAPGENKSVTAYVKNLGNVPGLLSMNTSNWQPLNASQSITLSWITTYSTLLPDHVTDAVFTLFVAPDIQGVTSFSFDINIWIVG